MKCYKGSIITLDKKNTVCKYLVEDKGNIIFVGNRLPKEYKEAEVIDLKEGALVPSFCDTHEHFLSFSLLSSLLSTK